MELTPRQRDLIQRLLEEELRGVYRHAVDRGVSSAVVDEAIGERRRTLEESTRRLVADDAQHPLDDPAEGTGIAQQR